jgi:hypothetical protein
MLPDDYKVVGAREGIPIVESPTPSSELSSYARLSVAAVEVFAQLIAALGRPALTRLQGLDQVLGRSKQPSVLGVAE